MRLTQNVHTSETTSTSTNGDRPGEAPARPGSSAPAPQKRLIDRLTEPGRELFAFCRRERLWTLMMALFITTWTIELFVLQSVTLVYPNATTALYDVWAPKIRLVLDLLFVSTLTIGLRRRWLMIAVCASFFVYLGLMTYFKYFLKPLSLLTIITSWREGLRVGGFAWDMFPRGAAAWLLAALLVQLTALYLSRNSSLPRKWAWPVASVLLAGYAALFAAANYFDPLSYIQSTRGVGRLGHIRGYLGPWIAECYYLRDDRLLQEVMERRHVIYDRLTPIEADIPIHKHLVIVQAESLDTNILGYRVGGVEVTPFLNRLRQNSMYFRVRALHNNGSADADFAALNGVSGSSRANTYSIPEYPYADTTPQLLASCGYETYSFHGNSGAFYDRRGAYEKMGFTDVAFREELAGHYDLPANRWGVQDADVLRLSAQQLRTARNPTCHFVITLTTHTPYTNLTPADRELFANPQTTGERYINNMRYLDNCLRDYITSLGSGTTVLLYADHPTEAFSGFVPDRDVSRELEYVPCFIYDSDRDLSKIQKTRDLPISTDGSLNLVDVINYLRGQVKLACQEAQQQAPAGSDRAAEQKDPIE